MSKQLTLGAGFEKYAKTTRREKFLDEIRGGPRETEHGYKWKLRAQSRAAGLAEWSVTWSREHGVRIQRR